MEILLNKNWDTPITPPYHDSVPAGDVDFIGRVKEIELLKNDILRKNQGSILVSGHRGVGKTSFVYKVLQLVKAEKKTGLIYIYINAGQLDNGGTGDAGQITTESILKTLIRRLYATAKDIFTDKSVAPKQKTNKESEKIKKIQPEEKTKEQPEEKNFSIYDPLNMQRLERLYRKAVAKEFNLEETVLNTNTATTLTERTRETKASLDNLKLSQFTPAISAISLVAGLGIFIFHPFNTEIINKIVSFILALPLAISFTYSSLSSTKNEKQSQVQAKELYQIDNNLGNLEYDLEEFHRSLHSKDIKIVYVIDELDKLKEEQIKKVLRYLKNLFTLSKAIFIFIGNEDLYEMATKEVDDNKFRPEYYTFFTSKYFIGRPTIDELKEYFFSKIEQDFDKQNVAFQRAAHYFAYESKGDLFNLVNTLKDSIIRYEEKSGRPVIDVAVNSPVVLKKSRLHKSISVVFFQTYFSTNVSRMRDNELLHRQLIDYMYELKAKNTQDICQDPANPDQQSGAIRDINRFLSSINFLLKQNEQIIKINGVDTEVSNYTYTGQFNSEPPDKMEIFSEKEKSIATLGDEYLKLLLPVINAANFVDGENTISMKQLCDDLTFLLKKGLPGIDPATSLNWPEIYFDLQLQQPLQESSPEKIEMGITELNDSIGRMKASLFSIYKVLILKWFDKNGYVEGVNLVNSSLLNMFRASSTKSTDLTNFFYVVLKSGKQDWSFAFSPLSQPLINAINSIEKKQEFKKMVTLFILETSPDDPEQLKQYLTANQNQEAIENIHFMNLGTTDQLTESLEKSIKIIREEDNMRKAANADDPEFSDLNDYVNKVPA